MVAGSPKRGVITPAPVVQLTTRTIQNTRKVSSYRRAVYLQQVRDAEQRYELPSGLLDALIWTESRYNPMALSRAGAAGLGQLMPATALAMGVANRFEPRANILGAARNLRVMLDQFGAINLAIAAYNAGPGAIRAARGIPTNDETPDYVRRVLNFWRVMSK
jgi:soluble lytic murein transglycosylase-like protein